MRVAIRVDASRTIGTGHLARCLTLARCLVSRGHDVKIVARDLDGSGLDRIEPQLRAHRLDVDWPEGPVEAVLPAADQIADAEATRRTLGGGDPGLEQGCVDWVVLDSYGLSAPWESRARDFAVGVMVIDDLANRPHDCDLLLDQNRPPSGADAYAGLVPEACGLLLGPRWALLRPEFDEARSRARVRCGEAAGAADVGVRRVLVFLGGADAGDHTSLSLRALAPLAADGGLDIDVVLGAANPHRTEVEELAQRVPGATVSVDVSDMAERILAADVAVGAAGTATWERVHLGLPSVLLVVAENQREVARVVDAAGAGWAVPYGASETGLRELVSAVIARPERVAEASRRAFDLAGPADRPAADRLAEELERAWVVGRPHVRLRRLRLEDRDRLRLWRNSERVRLHMADRHVIGDSEHDAWFDRQLAVDPPSHLVFETDGAPAGLASLTGFDEGSASCEWGFYLGETILPSQSGARLCYLLLDYAFEHRGCASVRARVRRDNERSLALHARFGFAPDSRATSDELDAFELSAEMWASVREAIASDIFGSGSPAEGPDGQTTGETSG